MFTLKLHPGHDFPPLNVNLLPETQTSNTASSITLGRPRKPMDWQLVVVYRGRHCPLCTRFLNELEQYVEALEAIGVDLIAVSADSKEQALSHREKLTVSFPIGYGLTSNQMESLGVYISQPRSPQETDHLFAEPGLFVVNEQGGIQVVDLSNNPFVRPNLDQLVSGLTWIRDPKNHYPIRGTHFFKADQA